MKCVEELKELGMNDDEILYLLIVVESIVKNEYKGNITNVLIRMRYYTKHNLASSIHYLKKLAKEEFDAEILTTLNYML